MSSDKNAKLLLVFSLGFFLLNFPILAIFGTDGMVLGIPVLYLYVFFTWLGIILLTRGLTKRK